MFVHLAIGVEIADLVVIAKKCMNLTLDLTLFNVDFTSTRMIYHRTERPLHLMRLAKLLNTTALQVIFRRIIELFERNEINNV